MLDKSTKSTFFTEGNTQKDSRREESILDSLRESFHWFDSILLEAALDLKEREELIMIDRCGESQIRNNEELRLRYKYLLGKIERKAITFGLKMEIVPMEQTESAIRKIPYATAEILGTSLCKTTALKIRNVGKSKGPLENDDRESAGVVVEGGEDAVLRATFLGQLGISFEIADNWSGILSQACEVRASDSTDKKEGLGEVALQKLLNKKSTEKTKRSTLEVSNWKILGVLDRVLLKIEKEVLAHPVYKEAEVKIVRLMHEGLRLREIAKKQPLKIRRSGVYNEHRQNKLEGSLNSLAAEITSCIDTLFEDSVFVEKVWGNKVSEDKFFDIVTVDFIKYLLKRKFVDHLLGELYPQSIDYKEPVYKTSVRNKPLCMFFHGDEIEHLDNLAEIIQSPKKSCFQEIDQCIWDVLLSNSKGMQKLIGFLRGRMIINEFNVVSDSALGQRDEVLHLLSDEIQNRLGDDYEILTIQELKAIQYKIIQYTCWMNLSQLSKFLNHAWEGLLVRGEEPIIEEKRELGDMIGDHIRDDELSIPGVAHLREADVKLAFEGYRFRSSVDMETDAVREAIDFLGRYNQELDLDYFDRHYRRSIDDALLKLSQSLEAETNVNPVEYLESVSFESKGALFFYELYSTLYHFHPDRFLDRGWDDNSEELINNIDQQELGLVFKILEKIGKEAVVGPKDVSEIYLLTDLLSKDAHSFREFPRLKELLYNVAQKLFNSTTRAIFTERMIYWVPEDVGTKKLLNYYAYKALTAYSKGDFNAVAEINQEIAGKIQIEYEKGVYWEDSPWGELEKQCEQLKLELEREDISELRLLTIVNWLMDMGHFGGSISLRTGMDDPMVEMLDAVIDNRNGLDDLERKLLLNFLDKGHPIKDFYEISDGTINMSDLFARIILKDNACKMDLCKSLARHEGFSLGQFQSDSRSSNDPFIKAVMEIGGAPILGSMPNQRKPRALDSAILNELDLNEKRMHLVESLPKSLRVDFQAKVALRVKVMDKKELQLHKFFVEYMNGEPIIESQEQILSDLDTETILGETNFKGDNYYYIVNSELKIVSIYDQQRKRVITNIDDLKGTRIPQVVINHYKHEGG